jgi:hypothetical protein
MPLRYIPDTPGVFIQEIQLPGPIAGVGTSTAAFIGPAKKGPINKPTLLTSWTQFVDKFGIKDDNNNVSGTYFSAPPVYVTHAVRGFFANGGTSCYFVRVSKAARASLTLKDRNSSNPLDTLVLTAKQEGAAGNNVTVEVKDSSLTSPELAVVKAQANLQRASGTSAVLQAPAVSQLPPDFKVGDSVQLMETVSGTLHEERTVIRSISNDGKTLSFQGPNLSRSYGNTGAIRIANIPRVPATNLRSASGTSAELSSVADFKVGDVVWLVQGQQNNQATISNVQVAPTNSHTILTFKAPGLGSATYNGGTIRTIDTFRVEDTTSIQKGDALRVPTVSNPVTVGKVSQKRITLQPPDLISLDLSNSTPIYVQPFVTVARVQASISSVSGKGVTLASVEEAQKFRVGDAILLEQTGGSSQSAKVQNIQGTDLVLDQDAESSYATDGTIRINDLDPGLRTFRVADSTGLEAGSCIQISQQVGTSETKETLVLEAVSKGGWITTETGLENRYNLANTNPPVLIESLEFSLIIGSGGVSKPYPNLSMDPRHSRYVTKQVNSKVVAVTMADPPTSTPPPNNRPAVFSKRVLFDTNNSSLPGTPGRDNSLAQLAANDFKGAISQLERVDDVNLLCIPDSVNLQLFTKSDTEELQKAMLDHCEGKMQDRFAILDPLPKSDPQDEDGIRGQRNDISSDRGFGALYYPQLVISDPVVAGNRLTVPPSGHIAGVYARSDSERGVFKAPANEAIRGVMDLERTLTDEEQSKLNPQGINLLRAFPGEGIKIWGARTLATRTQWRFINARRLLLYVEESIQKATRFAVFEPNNRSLWKTIERQVNGFLMGIWQEGGLFGATPDEAFRVRIDDELNPPEAIALGRLTIEVIVRPTMPAEVIVFRVIQDPTGASLQE